jgi:hypothetical protein
MSIRMDNYVIFGDTDIPITLSFWLSHHDSIHIPLSPIRVTYPAHIILLVLIILIILGEK